MQCPFLLKTHFQEAKSFAKFFWNMYKYPSLISFPCHRSVAVNSVSNAVLFEWNEIHAVLFKLYEMLYIHLWFHSSCNFFKIFVQIIKAIHRSKKVLPVISYVSNKSSFFFSLVAPVIFVSYQSNKNLFFFSNLFYCLPWVQIFLCQIYLFCLLWWCQHFHLALETEKKIQKESLIFHIFSIYTSKINFISQQINVCSKSATKTLKKVWNMFKANNKYQTPDRRQVDDDFQVNFGMYFSPRSSVFIVNFEQVMAGYNKSVFN